LRRAGGRQRGRARGGKHGAEPRPRIRERQRQGVARADQGWTQQAIAGELGISQAAVSKMLRRVDAREAAALGADLARRRARQIRRLEHLLRETLQAWEASKAPHTRRRQRQTTHGGGPESSTAEVTVEEHPGDPRFLEQARRIEEQIAALCGFDRTRPPVPITGDDSAWTPDEMARRSEVFRPRFEHTGKDGGPIQVQAVNLEDLTDAEFEQLNAAQQLIARLTDGAPRP
jgi:transcriptional regulator with XRE-family HTH domain